jgi:hypothetical protein
LFDIEIGRRYFKDFGPTLRFLAATSAQKLLEHEKQSRRESNERHSTQIYDPVERFFGYLRRVMHDVNPFKQMAKSIAKVSVTKKILNSRNGKDEIPTRMSIVTVKIFSSPISPNDPPQLNLTGSYDASFIADV